MFTSLRLHGPRGRKGEGFWDATQSAGRSVKLFLADGTAHGIVVAEIGNWTGKVLAAPRGRLGELLCRPEAGRTGIYVLLGPDPERPDGLLAYVGEADDIAARLRNHLRSEAKDFANRFALMVSADDSLTKAHARYLEGRLIRLIKECGSVQLTNDTAPDVQRLPEADKVDMEFFLSQVVLILPLVGFDLFRKASTARSQPRSESGSTFTFAPGGASARAREDAEGFVVLSGSTARRGASETFPAGYRALRDKLLATGQLVEDSSPELYRFVTGCRVLELQRRRIDHCGQKRQWTARVEAREHRPDLSRLASGTARLIPCPSPSRLDFPRPWPCVSRHRRRQGAPHSKTQTVKRR